MNSINAVGVDIAPLSAMSDEEEVHTLTRMLTHPVTRPHTRTDPPALSTTQVLLLPGLPLSNRLGENPEPDLWTFEVETPDASVATGGSPPAMIDYVHPGTCIPILFPCSPGNVSSTS